MVDGNVNLSAGFFVRRTYDFSKAWAMFFHWWGAGNEDLTHLRLETPTGNLLTSFPDGPARFREIIIPMGNFTESGIVGSRPDRSQITAILWTVASTGTRRLDLVGIYTSPILKGIFEVRRSTTANLVAGFTVRDASSGELSAKFSVN